MSNNIKAYEALSTKTRNQAYFNWIKTCNTYQVKDYIPFVIDEQVLGYVHKNQLSVFKPFDSIFIQSKWQQQNCLTFHPDYPDFDSRTHSANLVATQWYESGVLKSWVGEQYAVNTGFNHEPFFTVERSAASLFGIKKYGVHVNAWVQKEQGVLLWVAKRAKDKPTFPGKLDHLVAGGHSVGHSIMQTFVKECAEEANIPESLAMTGKPVALVSYVMGLKDRLQQDNLFVFDIQLPEDFVPENTDGEVESFELWPIEQVLYTVATTDEYKTNCNLVIIDFAIRHGLLQPDEPFYSDICKGLIHSI